MSRPLRQGWHWILPTLAVHVSSLSAATIRVPEDAGSIQNGIELASNGDVVAVAPGTWHGSIDFGGRSITVRSLLGAEVTMIDASGTDGPAVTFASGESRATVLEGFAICGGNGTISGDGTRIGGGLFIHESAPTIRLCLISGNTSDTGGGIAVVRGSPLLEDVHIYNNSGGGLYVKRCLPSMVQTVIEQNAIVFDNAPPLSLGTPDRSGGCCLGTHCINATAAACHEAGGTWLGQVTPCALTPCPDGCLEDLSGDGRVNSTDLMLVLAAWGGCP